jgi:cytochrome c oxidase assembly protein subunit 15
MGKSIAREPNRRAIANWLLIGVGMIMVQVLLGGITRLTGSGLSITEWKPILGALPPMNEADWTAAFEKYKQIGQFKHINFDFTLSDFKFIYFWEWFHRQWARLIGVVFLIPFVWFIVKGMIAREMVIPMAILFLLGALQGAIGWIMVKSGLNEENLYVSHIRLAVHFLSALGLLCYTLWFAFRLLVDPKDLSPDAPTHKGALGLTMLLVVQLAYGAFMAGLKAGAFAPTWPDINGSWWPSGLTDGKGGFFLTDNPLTVQMVHRLIAYVLALSILWWTLSSGKRGLKGLLSKTLRLPLLLVVAQVVLGILTVVNSDDARALLWLGVAHQFVAMLLLMSMMWVLYLTRPASQALTTRA